MKRKAKHRGFTLVESLVALTIMSIAASALLLGVQSSLQNTATNIDRTIALGMATQLIDEIAGNRYMAIGDDPYQYPFGPSSWETSGTGRERFDDIDDFKDFSAKEPEDLWGMPIARGDSAGGLRQSNFRIHYKYFQDWRQDIKVGYVDENDPSVWLAAGVTSNYKAVEVTIFYDDPISGTRELAKLKRVFSYIPIP